METIFENKCTYTYKYYLQLRRKTMDRNFMVTGWVLTAIFISLAVLCTTMKWYGALVFVIAVLLFLLYRVIGTPMRLALYSARKNREVHGGRDIETEVLFYEEHFLALNKFSKGKTNIKYVDVVRLLETKDLFIIEMEQKLNILIDKSGFTKGAKEEFLTFIRNKCINAEVKI